MTPAFERNLKIAVTAMSALGIAFMGYLTKLHFAADPDAVCEIAAGLSCNIVNQSLYAVLFGVPVSILGMLYFAAMGATAWLKVPGGSWRMMMAASLASLVFSIYLTYIENVVIGSVCVFCELSKVLIAGIALSSLYAVRKQEGSLPRGHAILSPIAGAALSAVAYLLQR